MASEDIVNYISSRISGFKRRSDDFPAGSLDFFPSGNEMGPIGAFHENVRQHSRHQCLGCLLIKTSNRVDSRKSLRDFRPFLLAKQRARSPFIRRTPASEFSASTSTSPSERACSNSRIWPGCSRS